MTSSSIEKGPARSASEDRVDKLGAVYVVNSHRGAWNALRKLTNRDFRFCVFKEHLFSSEKCMMEAGAGTEIGISGLMREVNTDFGKDFVSWMARTTQAHASPLWVRMNFTGKSALSTPLCERMFYAVCLTRLLEIERGDLVIVFDDDVVVRQIKRNIPDREIHDLRKRSPLWRRTGKDVLPGGLIRRFLVTIARKGTMGAPSVPKNRRSLVVVKTVISAESFTSAGDYRDVYFGDLLDLLSSQKREWIVAANVLNAHRRLCAWQDRRKDARVFALEQILGIVDMLSCFVRSFWTWATHGFRKVQLDSFRGVDVSTVVTAAFGEEFRSGQYVVNLMNARATEKMVRGNEVERILLPYENRGWERADMMVGHRWNVRVVGYQHAAITRKHTEYFRAAGDPLPLPNRIVTMGEITRRLLVKAGGYPSEKVRTGCALRQAITAPATDIPIQRVPRRFLILLSTSEDYYKRTTFVLNRIVPRRSGLEFGVRVHPLIPWRKPSRARFEFPVRSNFADAKEAMDWAEGLIYSSSTTMALRGLQAGKLVYYVPVDDYLDADPLFELDAFKWVIRSAHDFEEALSSVETMPPSVWRSHWEEAQRYVDKYFTPVTESAMGAFFY